MTTVSEATIVTFPNGGKLSVLSHGHNLMVAGEATLTTFKSIPLPGMKVEEAFVTDDDDGTPLMILPPGEFTFRISDSEFKCSWDARRLMHEDIVLLDESTSPTS